MQVLSAIALAALTAQTSEFTVHAGKHDRSNCPIRVPLSRAPGGGATVTDASGNSVPAQLTAPRLGHSGGSELHFILPRLKAGASARFKVAFSTDAPSSGGDWKTVEKSHAEYRFGARPVLRYQYAPLDTSTAEARARTNKPFHHLYDPAGKRFVTNGPSGKYPHHRGLFYGFSKITYGDGKKCNNWACTGKTYQAHRAFLAQESGPVIGRHRAEIGWHGQEGEPFADEQREVSVFNVAGGVLVEFRSEVGARITPVRLDGDPQHAGFHFRADNEVNDKWSKETTYIRPDGKGAPGQTRNWPGVKTHVNLAWNAMYFRLGERRYTAVYLDHPENPKEARFSERPYGRFGSYFVYELTDKERRCRIAYRVWIQEGEITGEQAAALSADFVSAPKVELH